MSKLTANAKFVADLAKRLDESGDSKDQAGTEANFKKLQGVLKQVQSLYPESAAKESGSAAVQDTPGNCPKCGMKLVVKKQPNTLPSR